MSSKIKSGGKCLFCEKRFAKAGISRHLAGHLKKEAPVAKKKSYHLRIEAGRYFINLLMDGDARMDELDTFLRNIWLECCGHLSQFSFDRWGEEIPMEIPAKKVFSARSKLSYVYDFGSTTELTIKTFQDYPIAVKEGILLLSRNEPLNIKCDTCQKKEAEFICTVHWDGGDCFFCEACTALHEQECDETEYAMYPVVNSPRMGVCAYDGGQIDVARD